ncbi:hypothetical protein [Desertimonas flava]|uniref:hypothetical protein n=1 Tax=Desertimonas flava TaxID=2064846 RepID=UPI000E357AD5|nr:hypothetical protein [Desertimonas flava]
MPRRLTVATALLAIVLGLGAVYACSALVVRQRILAPATYTSALADSDATRRVYTDVIPDPELSGLVQRQLGNLGVDSALVPQATALATNIMRFVLPPDRIDAGADIILDSAIAYIRGDSDDLIIEIDLTEVVERFDEATVIFAQSLLASAIEDTSTTVSGYTAAVKDFVDELVAGRVPDVVPVLGGTEFDPESVLDAILDATGAGDDPDLREQITASVLVHDERNALIVAAAAAVEARGLEAATELRRANGQALVDVIGEIADRAGMSRDRVTSSLDTARSVARFFAPVPAILAAVFAVLAAVGIAVLHRDRWRVAAAWIAGALGVATTAFLVLWRLVGSALDAPLERLTGSGPGTWNLPAGTRGVLSDVARDIGDEVAGHVLWIAAVLGALAFAVAAVAAIATWKPRVPAVRAGVAATAAALIVALPVAGLRAEPSLADRACNGAAELCDRPYDEVAYAATHNSMSSPHVVPVWPEHDSHLRAQLDAGVRALLIDTKYWEPVDGAAALTGQLDPTSLPIPRSVADTVVRLLGDAIDGRPGTFLCHNSCMFGAQPLVDGLADVRGFLEDNPDEVVSLIIQDEISVADTETAFEDAGLMSYVYRHDDRDWPTLGELIDSGERLVVFAENEGPPPDWYANAFESMQETPFLVLERDAFTCDPARGDPDATLFQLNHWVQRVAPDPADAAVVNSYDFLLARARECQEARGLLPNFVAVNFYSIGDLFAVVDTLNGLDAS